MRITDLRARGIFDSRATATVEVEVTLDDAYTGRGSSPRAIAPGRRERARREAADLTLLGELDVGTQLRGALLGRSVGDSRDADSRLDELHHAAGVGSDATLAVSLALARAFARARGLPLVGYLADLAGTEPALPRLLVNVYSGGIHGPGRHPDGFQQVMLIPATGRLVDDIAVACAVFAEAERLAAARYGEPVLSASSGLVVPADSTTQLDLLSRAIETTGHTEVAAIGVDVAAEHLLAASGRYRFAGRDVPTAEFTALLADLARSSRLSYLEDPFDPADEDGWRALRRLLPATTTVVGDDLFATDAGRVSADLADAILLKPSQAGTVTATLDAARAARSAGMGLAVSHRSGETEDTGICDLAAALGADLIKLGGPRRGDRLAKYNQLIRLAERVPAAAVRPVALTTEGEPR